MLLWQLFQVEYSRGYEIEFFRRMQQQYKMKLMDCYALNQQITITKSEQ